MDTIFSYELRREQPLSTEEKQRIRVILDAYRIPEEQLSSWNGGFLLFAVVSLL